MHHWSYLYYADIDYGDAMAASFVAQIDYLARTDPAAAVYRQSAEDGAAHYYFSPAAAQIARRFFATPCSEPLPAQRGRQIGGRLAAIADA